MDAAANRTYAIPIHPLHSILLAGAVPLFLGGLLSDWAYSSTYQIQWSNMAAWLIAGAMVFVGLALLWALVDLVRSSRRGGRRLPYVIVLVALFAAGLINSFVHARDAWAVMPQGLILSIVVTVLAIVALWLGHAGARAGGRR